MSSKLNLYGPAALVNDHISEAPRVDCLVGKQVAISAIA